MAEALRGLGLVGDPNVLVGLARPDDAGIYRLSDEIAIVQTVDYFTPIVDDPRTFGRIAAANALSDVWAMGARPVCAMNIVCFPAAALEIDVLRGILEGGLDAMREAQVALVGGHSITSPELSYGLSVTGVVHPQRYLTKTGARAGDVLVLTKPLGTGAIATGLKGAVAEADWVEAMVRSMCELNRAAAGRMLEHAPHACSDVTGFGLVGHACEMLQSEDVGLVVRAGSVPLLPGARLMAEMGLLPAGLHRNREYYRCRTVVDDRVPAETLDLLFDPQTSGGLLVAMREEDAAAYLEALAGTGRPGALVGRFVADHRGKVRIRA